MTKLVPVDSDTVFRHGKQRMDALANIKVCLIHDWLTGMRGGEKCLEHFCRKWPDAPLFTLLHKRGSVSRLIEDRPIQTSFLQWFPGVHQYYRYLLPMMPRAVEWTLPECDLVLSSSHCVAKSVIPPEGVPHVCYCFTPMRYAWHMKQSYFAERRGLKARLRDLLLSAMRKWDQQTADRVTHFIAISRTVQRRIQESYGRDSVVIYPPVDTDFYHPAPVKREDYYLVISAFAPYKRIDLAISACNVMQRQLVIIGQGQDERKLRALAGPTVHFLGWQSNESIRGHLRRCRALLFPGEEDFGIVPLEAQACGTPVLAYGKGGATETVVPARQMSAPTGMWFDEQCTESLIECICEFELIEDIFSPNEIRRHAQAFQGDRFERELFEYLRMVLGDLERTSLAA